MITITGINVNPIRLDAPEWWAVVDPLPAVLVLVSVVSGRGTPVELSVEPVVVLLFCCPVVPLNPVLPVGCVIPVLLLLLDFAPVLLPLVAVEEGVTPVDDPEVDVAVVIEAQETEVSPQDEQSESEHQAGRGVQKMLHERVTLMAGVDCKNGGNCPLKVLLER